MKKIENFLFKKIELWILILVIIFFIIFSLFIGILVRQGLEGRTKFGSFSIESLTTPIIKIVRIPERIIGKVLKPNDNRIGDPWDTKRNFLKNKGFSGQNPKNYFLLLSRYDIESEQSIVELVDLKKFKIIHKWVPDINKFNDLIDKKNDQFRYQKRDQNKKRFVIYHPYLTEKGGLIFSDKSQLINIDICSNLVWQNQEHIFHHSKEPDIYNKLWIPADLFKSDIKNYEKAPSHNAIVQVDSDGKIIFLKSLFELFIENNLEYYIHGLGFSKSNLFHLNDIEPAKINSDFWNVGDVFLSLRNLSLVILYRPSENKILNIIHGPFYNQHDVDILNENEISIFNNNKKSYGVLNTEIIKYNFKTKKFSKYFEKSLSINKVKTPYQGVHEILPSGELFLESTTDGRILFFDNKGKLQWQFVNNNNKMKELYSMGWSRILYTESDIKKINMIKEKNCK